MITPGGERSSTQQAEEAQATLRVLVVVGATTGVGVQPLDPAGATAPDPVALPPGLGKGSASDMDPGRDPGRVSVSDLAAVGLVDMGLELALEMVVLKVAREIGLPQFLEKQRKNATEMALFVCHIPHMLHGDK